MPWISAPGVDTHKHMQATARAVDFRNRSVMHDSLTNGAIPAFFLLVHTQYMWGSRIIADPVESVSVDEDETPPRAKVVA